MERRLNMSIKELCRLEELKKVHDKRQTVNQAAQNLGLSPRQVKRLSKALRLMGPEGLISKKVGAPSNHRLPGEVRSKVVDLIVKHYSDFGPTLAHEYLTEQKGLSLSVSSVRTIMLENDLWNAKKVRKQRVFQLRPRRPKEGELIQVDGSEHDWFEGRGPGCTLLAYIDDATSKIMLLKFVKSESLASYFMATREYLEKYGRPEALYPDKHGVFRVNRDGALAGNGMTQFGRSMKELDIELICANTPQAKGRVERRHRDLQNRLIKAMRLQNVNTIDDANAFVSTFVEDFNRRFAKPPLDSTNAHKPLLNSHNLDKILCIKQERILSKNLILQYKNVIYQIITEREVYAMRKAKVEVMESMDGKVTIEYKGKHLKAVPYHEVQARAEIVSAKELSDVFREKKRYRPNRSHPWKRGPRGFSRKPVASCY